MKMTSTFSMFVSFFNFFIYSLSYIQKLVKKSTIKLKLPDVCIRDIFFHKSTIENSGSWSDVTLDATTDLTLRKCCLDMFNVYIGLELALKRHAHHCSFWFWVFVLFCNFIAFLEVAIAFPIFSLPLSSVDCQDWCR